MRSNAMQEFLDGMIRLSNERPEQTNLPPNVLIIDDDAEISKVMRESLESEGCRVDVCKEPDTGIQKILSHLPYSDILLDLNFPNQESGVYAMRAIRQILPKVKITIVSGFIDERFSNVARELGVTMLQKPFDLTELKEIVKSS